MIIGNPGNGEFCFAGAGGGAATAAYATGYVAYAGIEQGPAVANVAEGAGAARAAGSMPIACPDGVARRRRRAATARIDPAGAGLALIARADETMSRPKLSRRGGAVDPFIVMDVMAAAAEKEAAGDTVIHLEVGQPSTPAPKGALAAAHAALDSRPHRLYRGARHAGAARAHRAALSRGLRAEVSPERVIVTTGSSGGFPLAFLASFDAGDRVALAAPGYPAYRNILTALDLEAVDLPTSAADPFPADRSRRWRRQGRSTG